MFKLNYVVVFVMGISVTASTRVFSEDRDLAEREAMYRKYLDFPSYVKGGRIEPHWMADGNSFWFAEGAPGNTVIWKVDPSARDQWKAPLFKTRQLRAKLAKTLGHQPLGDGLPFSAFQFTDETEKAVTFEVANQRFRLELGTNQLESLAVAENGTTRSADRTRVGGSSREVLSPDGRWFLGEDDFNIYLRSAEDRKRRQLTADGTEFQGWGIGRTRQQWSPDSSKFVVFKFDDSEVPRLPIVDYLGDREQVEWINYSKATDPWGTTQPYVADVNSGELTPVLIGETQGFIRILGWRPDSTELLLLQADRYLRQMRLFLVNTSTGETKVVHEDSSTSAVEGWRAGHFRLLKDNKRLLFKSKQDGWTHLSLHRFDGQLIHRITKGPFNVQSLLVIDEEAGHIFFTASSAKWRWAQPRHLYRANLDGTGQKRLFDFEGEDASIVFSPSRQFFLHFHHTDELLPLVDLCSADGKLVGTVSSGVVSADLRWKPPEVFEYTAADGRTKLAGVLYKPYDFDPTKKYAVIDDWFRVNWVGGVCGGTQALAQLGFVGVILISSGSREDNTHFGRNEVADHAAALEQLAAARPYIDRTRVGILGASWSGYHAVHAMLTQPDSFHVGVAYKPITDMAAHFGNDIEIGPPEENRDAYEYANNIRLAGNLQGKLLLVHGTADKHVPFSHTMRMVDALTRSGKRYDLLVVPGQGHVFDSETREYATDAIRRYFQEHLGPPRP